MLPAKHAYDDLKKDADNIIHKGFCSGRWSRTQRDISDTRASAIEECKEDNEVNDPCLHIPSAYMDIKEIIKNIPKKASELITGNISMDDYLCFLLTKRLEMLSLLEKAHPCTSAIGMNTAASTYYFKEVSPSNSILNANIERGLAFLHVAIYNAFHKVKDVKGLKEETSQLLSCCKQLHPPLKREDLI